MVHDIEQEDYLYIKGLLSNQAYTFKCFNENSGADQGKNLTFKKTSNILILLPVMFRDVKLEIPSITEKNIS